MNSAVVLLTKLGIPQRGTFLSVHVFLSTNVAFMCIADTNLRGFAANITSLSNSTSPSAYSMSLSCTSLRISSCGMGPSVPSYIVTSPRVCNFLYATCDINCGTKIFTMRVSFFMKSYKINQKASYLQNFGLLMY